MSKTPKLDFVGIGFQKCGTTSLFEFLRRDATFSLPQKKELHHFCTCARGVTKNEFENFLKQTKKNQLIGEITPCYITSEESIIQLKNHNKQLKILICIRDPIDRFVSAYIHARKIGAIPEIINADYLIELEAIMGRYSWIQNIVSQGRYVNYIKTLWEYFPQKNTKIILLEDIKKNKLHPQQIKEFLSPQTKEFKNSIDTKYPHSLKHDRFLKSENSKYFLSEGKEYSSKNFTPNMQEVMSLDPKEIRKSCETKLQSVYKKSNKDLEKLLGRTLPW
jgi:hypothetical protein